MARAECKGRGEPEDGGVKDAVSNVASDCLFDVRLDAFLYSLFRRLLCLGADANAVADFLDAHVFEGESGPSP